MPLSSKGQSFWPAAYAILAGIFLLYGMSFFGGFSTYFLSVRSHWIALMSGLIGILISLYQSAKKSSGAASFYVVSAACLFFSGFQAWQDEHQALQVERILRDKSKSIGLLSFNNLDIKGYVYNANPTQGEFWITLHFTNLQSELIEFHVDKFELEMPGVTPIGKYFNEGALAYPNSGAFFSSVKMHSETMNSLPDGRLTYQISYHVKLSDQIHHTGKTILLRDIRTTQNGLLVTFNIIKEFED